MRIFRNKYAEQYRQQFADQFEPDGDAFLYRKSQKGPAIRVSAVERQRFIADHDRRNRHSTWIMALGLTLLAFGYVWWSFVTETEVSDAAAYAAVGAVAAVGIGYMFWAWGAPARELQRRVPVSAERSREEMKRLMLAKTSYAQIAGGAVISVLAFSSLALEHGGFAGWGRLWFALAGVAVVIAAVSAFRKWRFETRKGHRP